MPPYYKTVINVMFLIQPLDDMFRTQKFPRTMGYQILLNAAIQVQGVT